LVDMAVVVVRSALENKPLDHFFDVAILNRGLHRCHALALDSNAFNRAYFEEPLGHIEMALAACGKHRAGTIVCLAVDILRGASIKQPLSNVEVASLASCKHRGPTMCALCSNVVCRTNFRQPRGHIEVWFE